MISNTRFVRVLVGGLLAVGFTVGVAVVESAAQTVDRRTYFTFSGPVAVPGVTLPAGTYLFRIGNASGGNRDVVQVLSEDGQQALAMFFGRQVLRDDRVDSPEVRFLETAVDQPAAIQSWWYPQELGGYEFVYPREQARLLAMGANVPVLTTVEETRTPPETGAAELARLAPTGDVLPIEEPAPRVEAVQRGELAPQTLQIAEAPAQARASLPRTASALPLVAVGAMGLLLGAAVLRRRRLALD